MAILKIEILDSQIQINYEINEREKLINLIENFKKRLSDFPKNERISNNTIIFLAALRPGAPVTQPPGCAPEPHK